MTATLGDAGARREWLPSSSRGVKVWLPHASVEPGEMTPPLFEVSEPAERRAVGQTTVLFVSLASSGVVTTALPPMGYISSFQVVSFGVSAVHLSGAQNSRFRQLKAMVRMQPGDDSTLPAPVASAEAQAIGAVRQRLATARRTRWQAFVEGLGRVFGLQPPRRSVPTIEEQLLEAMVQLDEASRAAQERQPPDHQRFR